MHLEVTPSIFSQDYSMCFCKIAMGQSHDGPHSFKKQNLSQIIRNTDFEKALAFTSSWPISYWPISYKSAGPGLLATGPI